MQDSQAFHRQLRETYRAIVVETFARARHCLALARIAHQAGDCTAVGQWIDRVRVLRMAAAEWRRRAARIAAVAMILLCNLLGCARVPPPSAEDLSAAFDVQPTEDGRGIIWCLHFSVQQYHRFLDTTPDGGERTAVRALIAVGLQMHHIAACPANEKAITKLPNGDIAFVGSCSTRAQGVPAGST